MRRNPRARFQTLQKIAGFPRVKKTFCPLGATPAKESVTVVISKSSSVVTIAVGAGTVNPTGTFPLLVYVQLLICSSVVVLGVFSLIGFFSPVWSYLEHLQESFPKPGVLQTAYDAFFRGKKKRSRKMNYGNAFSVSANFLTLFSRFPVQGMQELPFACGDGFPLRQK